MKKIIIFIITFIIITSCSSTEKPKETASRDYTKSMKILKDKRYIEAAESFEAIFDNYPLSYWSKKAQIMSAYSRFKDKNYNETIRVSESFLKNNPSSKYNSYLQYLVSLSYYNLIPNVDKGQNNSNLSSFNFRKLVEKYPNSKYIEDSKEALKKIDEHLAASKMSIGRYQIKKQNYIGAIANFNYVIKYFFNTKQVDEAYLRLYEIYYKLGMTNKADKIKEIVNIKQFSK